MSFIRKGQNHRRKAPVRKRPVWDDTVQDLTVYRATQEEIMLRKEAHKSKNHISVKLEKMRKEKQRSKMTGAEAQQLAIMKEVLYDQKQLQDVLARSDSMMAVVKDLFGDDPKRFMGFPNVTTAPQADSDPNRSNSLVASVPDIYTRTEKLSDSVMDQSALNDTDLSESEDEEIDRPHPISYESKLNLRRFQDYLQEEEKRTAQMDPPSLVSELNRNHSNRSELDQNVSEKHSNSSHHSEATGKNTAHMMHLLKTVMNQPGSDQSQPANTDNFKLIAALMSMAANNNKSSDFQTPTKSGPPLPSDRTPPSAMNDTKKVKRSKKCTKSPKVASDSMNTTANMSDMRKVLQELENEIAAYEHQTGRRPREETGKTETFSGYTIALVTAVSRLTKYLKETELRVRSEVTLREQLTQDVYQLRTIIDALATDIIVTQEEYGKLYSAHQRYKENVQTELTSVNNQIRELRHIVTGKESRPTSRTGAEEQQQQSHQQQPSQQPPQQQNFHEAMNASHNSKKSEESKTSTPRYSQHDTSTQSGSGSYQSLPTHLRPAESVMSSAAAAIMLSPPVRKTRVHTDARAEGNAGQKLPQRQTSLVDVAQLTNEGPARSTDPPRLTQAPPVMNTVNVPRPIPLVQSNVNIPLTSAPTQPVSQQPSGYSIADGRGLKDQAGTVSSKPLQINDLADLVKLGDETEHQIQQLQEMAVEEALNNPAMQSLMQSQIAELNRQQEEARRRLMDLLDSQRIQHKRLLQDQIGAEARLQEEFSPIRPENEHEANMKKLVQQSVSPPISPISQRSEREAMRTLQNFPQAGGRGITVSLPMVDLDVSEEP